MRRLEPYSPHRVISLRPLHFDAFGQFRFRSLISIDSDLIGNASISFTLERYCHVLPLIHIEAAAKVVKLLVAYFHTPKVVGPRTVGSGGREATRLSLGQSHWL